MGPQGPTRSSYFLPLSCVPLNDRSSGMWPVIGSMITGGASLLGSMFSAEQSGENTAANIHAQQMMQQQTQDFNRGEAQANRQFQAESADTNRQFQLQMSNSAYQRSMADMRAAGLNPILAYKQGGAPVGSGSSVGGSSASVGTPNMALHNTQSPWAGIGDAVNRVVSSAVQMKTIEKLTEEIANVRADTAKTVAAESLVKQQEQTERQETDRRKYEKGLSEQRLMPGAVQQDMARAILDLPAGLREKFVQAAFLGGKGAEALSAIPMFASGARAIQHLLPRERTVHRASQSGRDSSGARWSDEFTTERMPGWFGH